MKKKIAIFLLITILLISCGKNSGDQAALDEFEVLDINVDGLTDDEAYNLAYGITDEKYPIGDYEFNIEDKIKKTIDLSKSNLKLIADFMARPDEIIILDQEDNNIKVIDWDGNLIKTIGKLGSGEIEFKNPAAFYYDENSGCYYIVDDGNGRVVVLDTDFNFVKNIDVKFLKEKSSLNACSSIVLYKDSLYLSTAFAREEYMTILKVDPDGNEKLYDQRFGGFLKVIDNNLYAVQNHKGFKFGDKDRQTGKYDYSIWPSCGDALYLVEEDELKKLYDFPTLSNFTDMLKIGDSYYLPSGSFGILHEFKVVGNEMQYQKSLTHQMLDDFKSGVFVARRFKMQEMEGNILLMDAETDKIYIIDLTE